MNLLIDLIIFILITLVLTACFWIQRRLNYFKRNNVKYLKSVPLLGAIKESVLGREGLYETTEKLYNSVQFKDEPFFGIFMFHKPAILIRDPELIKKILVKDFNNFSNHHAYSDTHDPLGIYNLFSAKDDIWRTLRKKLTPFFTSGKMKAMFTIVDKIGDDLMMLIKEKSRGNNVFEVEIKNTASLFTIDVIGSCAFGIESKCIENPRAEFNRIGHKFFDFTLHRGIEFTSVFLLPEITKFFNLKLFTDEGEKFIMRTMTEIIDHRERSQEKRNDLIDTLIEIKKANATTEEGQKISVEMLIAQAAVFFSAGHETSSSLISFTLYELAKDEEVQDKVRAELRNAFEKNGGIISYDLVMSETPYLNQVTCEILRMYPSLPLIDRECSNLNGYSLKPYSDFVIPYKMPVYIPIYGLHRDEKYFENPLKFDPERFSRENIRKIPTCAYLPFGTGNRVCIGERLGLMQAKVALIKILKSYRMAPTETTPLRINLMKNAIIIQSDVPIVLNFIREDI